uniref:Uncharacterized protein n=1 Tax=viral metagenome TaxID=1070528 RepID=A0A6M3ITL9_9ZZZZ
MLILENIKKDKGKEPYEMSQEEYLDRIIENRPSTPSRPSNYKYMVDKIKKGHKEKVQQAISEGKITSHPNYPKLSKKDPTKVIGKWYPGDRIKFKNSGGGDFFGEITKVYGDTDTVDIQADGAKNSVEAPVGRIISLERGGRLRERIPPYKAPEI